MNNSELDAILKKTRTPEPSGEFWELFPRQIVSRLNRSRAQTVRVGQSWFPRLAWGSATAVCILAAFAIGHWRGQVETKTAAENDILQNAKFVQETLAMFPNQLRDHARPTWVEPGFVQQRRCAGFAADLRPCLRWEKLLLLGDFQRPGNSDWQSKIDRAVRRPGRNHCGRNPVCLVERREKLHGEESGN